MNIGSEQASDAIITSGAKIVDINRQPVKIKEVKISPSTIEQGVIIGYDFNNNRMAIKKYKKEYFDSN